MKKLINDPADVVADALAGIEAAHPDLRVDHANKVIYRADAPRSGKVGLVSGGGSGHEPLHGGFVGPGMLDAARAGEGMKIFIGSENKLFALSGSSVIAAPYRGREGKVVGVVGVIGPTRLNYARVVPMVDFTAQALSRLMS